MPISIKGDDGLRKLNIKTNTIKRYIKDLAYYQRELQENRSKQQAFLETSEPCVSTARNLQEIVNETAAMLPDCEERLRRAREDLEEFLKTHASDAFGAEAYEHAQQMLSGGL